MCVCCVSPGDFVAISGRDSHPEIAMKSQGFEALASSLLSSVTWKANLLPVILAS